MDRSVPTLITIAVVVLVFALMLRSWRRRTRRDAGLPAGYPVPAEAEAVAVVATAECFYVATTPRDKPLERLAIGGLGFRARADVTVTGQGLWLALAGEAGVYIPAAAIDSLTPATVVIDRVVETDGLLRLGWRLDTAESTPVDSYFRVIDPNGRRALSDAIRTITAGPVGPAGPGTTESEA